MNPNRCAISPVERLLLDLYLERGQRATFPNELIDTEDGLQTKLSFNAIRLWVQRIETADADWCQNLFDRAIHASSLGELLQE